MAEYYPSSKYISLWADDFQEDPTMPMLYPVDQ